MINAVANHYLGFAGTTGEKRKASLLEVAIDSEGCKSDDNLRLSGKLSRSEWNAH